MGRLIAGSWLGGRSFEDGAMDCSKALRLLIVRSAVEFDVAFLTTEAVENVWATSCLLSAMHLVKKELLASEFELGERVKPACFAFGVRVFRLA